MKIHLITNEPYYLEAVKCVADVLSVELAHDGERIEVVKSESAIQIQKLSDGYKIGISDSKYFLRAFGLTFEKMRSQSHELLVETPVYDSLGYMIDCSRNAALNFEAFKKMMNVTALMGYTTVQLYLEDMYEIEGYPYFGYMRGRYSIAQLKQMDDYAASVGIELVPAIQTLAHFGQALKWNVFKDIVDYGDILLIGDPKTYELIQAIFKTLSQAFRSRRVNIGMDEAHMVGLGKYLDKHGYQDRLSIMLQHFNKVYEVAKAFDFTPMLWSDMFFRLASGGDYYNPDCVMNEQIAKSIPKDVSLIYWDYYSEDKAIYDNMIKKHFELSDQIIFAGGAWKWMGYQPNNHFSEHVGKLAHASCKQQNIKHVLLTAWADNGAECSMFANLPALQLWAELCYQDNDSHDHLQKRLSTCANANFNQMMNLDLPMLVPSNPSPGKCSVNPSKYIMYQDILCGLFDRHIDADTYEKHFRQCATLYQGYQTDGNPWNYLFDTQHILCEFLAIKCRVGIDIRTAYQAHDVAGLKQIKNEVLTQLITQLDLFVEVYRAQWLTENKVFGLDIFDIRIGGLRQRIMVAIRRIDDYLKGRVETLEELEQDLLFYDGLEHTLCDLDISVPFWHDIQSASLIASI